MRQGRQPEFNAFKSSSTLSVLAVHIIPDESPAKDEGNNASDDTQDEVTASN
jgi:hypothetical protein